MEKRELEIYEAGETLLEDRLSQNIEAIQMDVQSTPEDYCGDFFQAIQDLMERVTIAQQEGKQGALRYIAISYLQSSLYTGSYKLRLDAYDERQFSDLADSHIYWTPHFILKHLEQDMAHFRKHIGQHIPRVQEYEVMRFMARYSLYYFQMILQLVSALIEPAIAQNIPETQALTVTFSGYMDEAIVLFDTEGV